MSSPSVRNGKSDRPASQESERFPKTKRLRKRAEFQRVYEEGARWTNVYFSGFCRKTGGQETSRVGLTVPRAVGNAVNRNRVKRRLREAIRQNWALLPAGFEIVFHARRPAAEAEWKALEAAVQSVFRNASKPRRSARKPASGAR
jgi:ribonuclease P protein component